MRALLITLLTLAFSLSWAESTNTLQLERMHIATDRHSYAPGQRVWMRVFMVDALNNKPISQSQYVYVELIDISSVCHNRVMLKAQDNIYCGYLDLPKDVAPSKYMLRAYTMAIAGNPQLECILPIEIKGNETTHTANKIAAHFTPTILTEQDGDSTQVYIIMDDECAAMKSNLAISLSQDAHEPACAIPSSLSRDIDTTLTLRGEPEMSQIVSGLVVTDNGTYPTSPVTVSLISPQENFYLTTKTDANGYFAFDNLELADSTVLIIQASDRYDGSELNLSIDTRSFPTCNYLDMDGDVIEDYEIDDTPFVDEKTIMLDRITVLGKHHYNTRRDPISLLADQSISLRRIKELDPSCLTDLFRRIAGVSFDVDGNIHMRAQHSIYGSNTATIAVDGVIMEGFDVNTIPIGDVFRVDVFKGGSGLIWGADGGGGVISITTKSGGDFFTGKKHSPNIKKIFPFGFQEYKQFEPTDSNSTLYWNPAVITQGNKMLTLKVENRPGTYITLQGITDTGKTIYLHSKL